MEDAQIAVVGRRAKEEGPSLLSSSLARLASFGGKSLKKASFFSANAAPLKMLTTGLTAVISWPASKIISHFAAAMASVGTSASRELCAVAGRCCPTER